MKVTFPHAIPNPRGIQVFDRLMYLVDTNVISASAPSKLVAPAKMITWMDTRSPSLFLSAVTVMEIEDGIAKARREGASRKAGNLAEWLETILHLYGDRIIAFDTRIASLAGALSDRSRGLGHAPGLADIIIAATAERRGLTILTRNMRHFASLGIPVLNPFEVLPP
jgi:predicted nucleic acid-binding protein